MGLHGEELVTLTEAKGRLHELVRDLSDRSIVLLRHGKPIAAIQSMAHYTALLDRIEDLEDQLAVIESRAESADMKVSWEKVKVEAGLM